jgi:hypothetical protein
LEKTKDSKQGFVYNIKIDDGKTLIEPPALQNIPEDKLIRIFRPDTKHHGVPPKEMGVFTGLCSDVGDIGELKDQYFKLCAPKEKKEDTPVEKPVEILKTDWDSLAVEEIEEDLMVVVLSSQYKTRSPVYLIAMGGSGVGKTYTISLVKHPDLVYDPDRFTANFWLPGTSDSDKEVYAGFQEALGKCFCIDEATILFSEKPDDANKIYAQLLSTYGKTVAKVKDPTGALHVYGDETKNPCSMILGMTEQTYAKNFMKLVSTGYRFIAKRYPINRSIIYVDGQGIVVEGTYCDGVEDPVKRNQQLTSHIFNTISKYKEMPKVHGDIIEKVAEISSKIVILSRIWYMTDETDGDSPNRLTSILVNVVRFRAMLHGRDPNSSDVEYAEKFTYELVPHRWEIRRFGLYDILVKDGVSVFDVPDGEDASMATGDYSESEFYAHAKQIMMNRIGSKAAKDLYNMVLSNGKLNDDWKRFINRLCKTARQRVSHKREFKKKQKEKNFTIVDEEPIADQENIE